MNNFVFDNNFSHANLGANEIDAELYNNLKPVMRNIFEQIRGLALSGRFGDLKDIDSLVFTAYTNSNAGNPYIVFITENYRAKTRFRIDIRNGPYPRLTLNALEMLYNELPILSNTSCLTITFFYQQFRSSLKKIILTKMYLNGKIDFDTYTKKINKT